jgi:hypothetical protein
MREFRETIYSVILRLQNLAQELLFNWWPDIQLDALYDDLATYWPGFLFLTHLDNKL